MLTTVSEHIMSFFPDTSNPHWKVNRPVRRLSMDELDMGKETPCNTVACPFRGRAMSFFAGSPLTK